MVSSAQTLSDPEPTKAEDVVRGCIFCNGRWESLHHNIHGYHEPIFRTNNMWILVTDIAPVCRGHLLAVAKEHTSKGLDDNSLADALYRLLADLLPTYHTSCGGHPIAIQHIRQGGLEDGPCIDHPHVHLVPTDAVNFSKLGTPLSSTAAANDGGVSAAFILRMPEHELRRYDASRLPRQYLRRIVLGGNLTWQESTRTTQSLRDYKTTLDLFGNEDSANHPLDRENR